MLTGMIYRCHCGFTRRTGWPARPQEKVCPSGHRMDGKIIEAMEIESVKCDSRCTNAKGHTCNCSCGGKNHGAAYA